MSADIDIKNVSQMLKFNSLLTFLAIREDFFLNCSSYYNNLFADVCFNDHQHLQHAVHSSGIGKLQGRNFSSVRLHGGAWGRESVLGEVLLRLTCSRELETRNTSDKKERKETWE